jgi:hypothetical protein
MTFALDDIPILPKLTIERMGCNPSRARDQNVRLPLCLIVGLIDRANRVTHSFRPNRTFIVLHGQFSGKNLENDREFRSRILQLSDSIRKQIIRFATKTQPSEFAVMI